jgi:hypothetical protein
VQSPPLTRAFNLRAARLVRHRNRLAEMGDRLLEGRATQGLITRLAPPFDRKVVEARLSKMMSNDFGLSHHPLWIVAQAIRGCLDNNSSTRFIHNRPSKNLALGFGFSGFDPKATFKVGP